jgi:endo-1,4-beta-xylanase
MVGLQMHLIADQPPDAASVRANMDRYAELGLGVQITEIDVRVREPATAADLEAQAEIYADMLQVCIDAPNCRHFTTWGASDVDSWIPGWFEGYGSAHLFDEQLEAKPAYHALTDVLAAYPVTPTGSGGAGGAEPVGAAGAGTGAVPSAAPVARDDDGCQCRVDTADPTRPSAWWAVVALALAAFWRRRR